MPNDVEAPTTPLATPGGVPKRRQMCLIFGLAVLCWGAVLLYLMRDVHLTDRQSYMDNLDFKGADIDSIFGVETASACYQRCEEHESCLAYTYVKSEHVCWLKGEGDTLLTRSSRASVLYVRARRTSLLRVARTEGTGQLAPGRRRGAYAVHVPASGEPYRTHRTHHTHRTHVPCPTAGYTSKANPNTVSGAINSTLAKIRRSTAGGRGNGSFGPFDSGVGYQGWQQEVWEQEG